MSVTWVVLLIVILVLLVVYTIHLNLYYLNVQCQTSPTFYCKTDWYCESSNTIGSIECDNDNCSNALQQFYSGSNSCSTGCESRDCSCEWSPTANYTGTIPSNAPPCSKAGFGTSVVTLGTFACSQENKTCPVTGAEGCDPYCIDNADYCC